VSSAKTPWDLLPGEFGKRRVLAIESLFATFAVLRDNRQDKIGP
jgi:hypothetical protein